MVDCVVYHSLQQLRRCVWRQIAVHCPVGSRIAEAAFGNSNHSSAGLGQLILVLLDEFFLTDHNNALDIWRNTQRILITNSAEALNARCEGAYSGVGVKKNE